MSGVAAPSSVQQIRVKYDGEAQKDHEMDIFALATSLEGLGKILKEANFLINDTQKIDIKVDAKFNEGSFEYLVDLVQYGRDVLPYIGLATTSLAAGSATFLEVLKKLKGSKIDYIESADEEGFFNLVINGEKVLVNDEVRKLAYSKLIREGATKVFVSPLSTSGTDEVSISNGSDQVVSPISKQESRDYRSPRGSLQVERPDVNEIEAKVKFVTGHTFKKTGWKIELSSGVFVDVTIADDLFMAKLEHLEEPYVLGKSFVVKLEETTKLDSIKGQVVTYKITKVLHPTA